MPDEPQNQVSDENSISPSPQEPMADAPVSMVGSEPSNMASEAPESPKNADIPVSLNNDNPQNEPISTPSPEELKPENSPAEGGKIEEITPVSSEPVQASETRTAHFLVFEPFRFSRS